MAIRRTPPRRLRHESGHDFGLVHQSTYSGTRKTAEYRNGGADASPIMGLSYYSTRGLWAKGQSSTSSTSIQDDLAIISSNNFGYRADDYGNDANSASPLVADGNGAVSASGVIEKTSDQDWFSFTTLSGPVNFAVAPASLSAMLHSTLELVSQDGTVVASAAATTLGQTITATVPGGTYDVVVGSYGLYGDIGQYTVSGTLPLDPNYVLPATQVSASVSGANINLTWADNATNENGYVVQQSTDGGNSWNTLTTLPADSTSYSDTDVSIGQQYSYRIEATGDVENSPFSATVTAGIIPAAPTAVVATPVAGGEVDLTWTASDGASGYKIERSTNGTTWTLAGTTTGDAQFASTGLAAATTYSFRVTATSSAGNSAPSSAIKALTTPAAPATLAATAASSTQINLTWAKAAGATGYHVERMIDGADWSLIATTGATVVTYSNTGLTAATTYQYRVKSFNASGDSLPTAVATRESYLTTPTGLAPVAQSAHEIDVTWNAVPSATGYKLRSRGRHEHNVFNHSQHQRSDGPQLQSNQYPGRDEVHVSPHCDRRGCKFAAGEQLDRHQARRARGADGNRVFADNRRAEMDGVHRRIRVQNRIDPGRWSDLDPNRHHRLDHRHLHCFRTHDKQWRHVSRARREYIRRRRLQPGCVHDDAARCAHRRQRFRKIRRTRDSHLESRRQRDRVQSRKSVGRLDGVHRRRDNRCEHDDIRRDRSQMAARAINFAFALTSTPAATRRRARSRRR